MNIKDLAKRNKEYAIQLRREFHTYPEKSMHEIETTNRIIRELENMDIPYNRIGKNAIIGIINDDVSDKKTIALRADTDALEIQEETTVRYKSKNDGLMHACGHDGHIASLLTAAKILKSKENSLNGRVILVFQPSEENGKGANLVINSGVLNDIDGIFGIHIWNDIETGKVSVDKGPRMASATKFRIEIQGQGGHGSMPHQGVDSVMVGSAITMNLQSIVSRELNALEPVVITIGTFHSGTRFNILADKAVLEGTTRCFNTNIENQIKESIERFSKKIAESYGASANVTFYKIADSTVNNKEMSYLGEKSITKILGDDGLIKFPKTTGAEDFSYYRKLAPTLFAFVGSKNEKKLKYYPHHHPKFNFDEDALEIASALYAQYAIDFLTE